MILLLIILAFLVGYEEGESDQQRQNRPVRIAFALPLLTNKEGKPMANYELADDAVAYVPIQTLDAEGNPVAPPAGDTFSVASSDSGSLQAVVSTMPSGPLQGAVCAQLTPLVQTASNITITVTDADNLALGTQVFDIVQGQAVSDFLDIPGIVLVPQAAPQAHVSSTAKAVVAKA